MPSFNSETESLILNNVGQKTIFEQVKHLRTFARIEQFKKQYEMLLAEVKGQDVIVKTELKRIEQPYETMRESAMKQTTKKIYFPALGTFLDFLRDAQFKPSRTNGKFAILPNDPIYVIILSFLSGFNADQCNDLLASGGYQKLHGRNIEESCFIYALNQAITYDKCVQYYIEKYKAFAVSTESISSFDKLTALAQELDKNDNECIPLTDLMTDKANDLENETELDDYFKENKGNFRNLRTTPIKYLCKWVSEYIENKKIDITANRFENIIRKIFCDFNNYYLNYTRFPLKDLYTTERAKEICGNEEGSVLDNTDDSSDWLQRIFSGEKELKRKAFVLLYTFFYQGAWKINDLEESLVACGFDVIDRDNKTIEDVFFLELSQKTNDNLEFHKFITVYEDILYRTKIYCHWLDFKQRISNQHPNSQEYVNIAAKMCDALKKVTYKQLADEDFVYSLTVFGEKLDEIYRMTSPSKKKKNENPFDFNTVAEPMKSMLDELKQAIDSLFEKMLDTGNNVLLTKTNIETLKESATQIKTCVDEFQKEYHLTEKRERARKLTVYIENPLYLDTRADF